MKGRFKKKGEEAKTIAKERIGRLFELAGEIFKEDPKLSDRYVEIAREIAMKARMRVQRELKRRFCKHCHKFLVPGANCRVRLHGGKVIYYCFGCKKYMRFLHSKERKAKVVSKAESGNPNRDNHKLIK